MWDREIGFGSSGVMTVWLKMARCGAVGALHLAIRFQPDSNRTADISIRLGVRGPPPVRLGFKRLDVPARLAAVDV
jgi:hypothetical protein